MLSQIKDSYNDLSIPLTTEQGFHNCSHHVVDYTCRESMYTFQVYVLWKRLYIAETKKLRVRMLSNHFNNIDRTLSFSSENQYWIYFKSLKKKQLFEERISCVHFYITHTATSCGKMENNQLDAHYMWQCAACFSTGSPPSENRNLNIGFTVFASVRWEN